MGRMPSLSPPAAWAIGAVAGPLGLYFVFLVLSINPFFQRHFLYAHRIHTLWWNDVNDPQKWGFAKNQVTPFTLTPVEGVSVYAWHVLPLPLYARYEDRLIEQPTGPVTDFTKTESFRILKEDPNARLVIYLHGNAGHIAQNIRAISYHTLTDTSTYHVLAINYRGFGHSSGIPSEEGLIDDATAAVDFALHTAGLSPSRIVLLGQSLGTAVTSAVAERFAARGVDFAGVVLVAGFSSLPTMLSGYSIAGFVPVLRPLKVFPAFLRWVLDRYVIDKWMSAARLGTMVREVKARAGRLRLSLVAAKDDWDIPCDESNKLFAAAVRGTLSEEREVDEETFAAEKQRRTMVKGKAAFVAEWRDSDLVIRQEQFPYGGHNDIMMSAPVTLAILRAFDLDKAN